jgi:hypothetical protein
MEEAGLIRRLPDPGGRRKVVVELTGRGKETYRNAVGVQAQKEALFAAALSDREKSQLNDLLRQLMLEFQRREGLAAGAAERRDVSGFTFAPRPAVQTRARAGRSLDGTDSLPRRSHHMQTSTRTLRLIAATAAALVLMTAVAQARPLTGNGPAEKASTTQAYAGTYRPVAPANNVALAHGANVTLSPDRLDKVGTTAQRGLLAATGGDTVVVHTTSNDGFDWTAAGIGAGTAFAIVLIAGAAGMTFRGRRGVALSS